MRLSQEAPELSAILAWAVRVLGLQLCDITSSVKEVMSLFSSRLGDHVGETFWV